MSYFEDCRCTLNSTDCLSLRIACIIPSPISWLVLFPLPFLARSSHHGDCVCHAASNRGIFGSFLPQRFHRLWRMVSGNCINVSMDDSACHLLYFLTTGTQTTYVGWCPGNASFARFHTGPHKRTILRGQWTFSSLFLASFNKRFPYSSFHFIAFVHHHYFLVSRCKFAHQANVFFPTGHSSNCWYHYYQYLSAPGKLSR